MENLWRNDSCWQFPNICRCRILHINRTLKCLINAQLDSCLAKMVAIPFRMLSNKFWPTLDKTIKEQELRSQNYTALSFQNNPSLVNCYRAVQHKSLVSDMFRWIKPCHMNPSHTIKEPTSAYMVPYWQLVFMSSSPYQSPAVNPKQLELWFIWLHHALAVLQCPISNSVLVLTGASWWVFCSHVT